jgi:superfamily II DNA/RNA helicase
LKFSEFKLDSRIMEGIDAIGFDQPTPVQEHAIPQIISGSDLIACAQTGTGKTAAYVLPLLHRIITDKSRTDTIKTLIIAPTRELAVQIDQQLEGFSYFAGVSSIAVYGGGSGTDFEVEKKAIKTGAEVLVATPGRLISHINSGYVDFSHLQFLILDEADRMLDMGFIPDIMKIISFLPKNRQTLLFSATMPTDIRSLAKKILHNPQEINLAVSKPAENVLQAAYLVYDGQKIALIKKLLTGKDLPSILIFSATKSNVKDLERELLRNKFNVKAIHSDLEQDQRKEVLRQFKNREVQILVATDIVSRGIDIDNISLVINYNVPQDAEDYVHRVGRTARADKTGVAITLINDKETWNFRKIEKLIETEVKKLPLPEGLGEGPVMSNSRPGRSGYRGRPKKGKGGFRGNPRKKK